MNVTDFVVPPGPITSTGKRIVVGVVVVVTGGGVGAVGVVVAGDAVNVTEADAVKVVLVAVTLTVCCVATVLGAVYNPLELMVPTAGLTVQVTVGGPLPPIPLEAVTVAVNCCVFAGATVTWAGVTDMV